MKTIVTSVPMLKHLLFFAFVLVAMAACKDPQNCVETIRPDCICTQQYDPVCGCNKKTYGNACAAGCAGITSYTKGECPPDPKKAAELEGVVWQLTAFTAIPEPLTVPENVTISVKFDKGTLNGHGGCNNVGGSYQVSGDRLTVGELNATEMLCQDVMEWEQMFLRFLKNSQSFTVNGERLEISCGAEGMLEFRKNWKKRN